MGMWLMLNFDVLGCSYAQLKDLIREEINVKRDMEYQQCIITFISL